MQLETGNEIRDVAQASDEGRIHFGQVVGRFIQLGIESYQVDYRACRNTYFLPDGETFTLEQHKPECAIAIDFAPEQIQAAIRGAQRGELMYPEFKRRSQAGGCIGYIVWIAGKHVTYFGRNGETHVEPFPQ